MEKSHKTQRISHLPTSANVRTLYVPVSGLGVVFEDGSRNIVKKLTRQGNSAALILNKSLLEMLEIDEDTELKLTVNGRVLTVEPLSETERAMRFEKVMKKTGQKNANLFKNLAK